MNLLILPVAKKTVKLYPKMSNYSFNISHIFEYVSIKNSYFNPYFDISNLFRFVSFPVFQSSRSAVVKSNI